VPIADLLINGVLGHKKIIFLDGNMGYTQNRHGREKHGQDNVSLPGFVGLFELTEMTFGLKNADAT
jgi:hypothetical protein